MTQVQQIHNSQYNKGIPHDSNLQENEDLSYEKYEPIEPTKHIYNNRLTCLEIAEHIANCPICSKFYNTDKTIHNIIIVILSIICLALLYKISLN